MFKTWLKFSILPGIRGDKATRPRELEHHENLEFLGVFCMVTAPISWGAAVILLLPIVALKGIF